MMFSNEAQEERFLAAMEKLATAWDDMAHTGPPEIPEEEKQLHQLSVQHQRAQLEREIARENAPKDEELERIEELTQEAFKRREFRDLQLEGHVPMNEETEALMRGTWKEWKSQREV